MGVKKERGGFGGSKTAHTLGAIFPELAFLVHFRALVASDPLTKQKQFMSYQLLSVLVNAAPGQIWVEQAPTIPDLGLA